jgi:3-deoxy-manno-octulosonate cytidylyltransferase (CMP-KDO synthetase)
MSSTRLPGKPLADIHGRPMLAWVHDCAVLSGAQFIVIATDDAEVQQVSAAFGARVVLTSPAHQSGTDRLAEVIKELDLPDHQIVVNLQGDEPLMLPALLRQVAQLLVEQPMAALATLMVPIVDPHEFNDPAAVKVVVNNQGRALYFSRSPIPCYRDGLPPEGQVLGYRHLGLYAYRAGFLRRFVATPMAELEQAEKLEQLRALAMGETIAIAKAQAIPAVGVDTPADLARVRAVLAPHKA